MTKIENQCSETVYRGEFRGHRCQRSGKQQNAKGEWFCGQHFKPWMDKEAKPETWYEFSVHYVSGTITPIEVFGHTESTVKLANGNQKRVSEFRHIYPTLEQAREELAKIAKGKRDRAMAEVKAMDEVLSKLANSDSP